MLKKILTLLIVLLVSWQLLAQTTQQAKPAGLMIDLVAASDYQSINGYAIQPSPANLLNPNVQSVFASTTL